jgi:hypothetical protein
MAFTMNDLVRLSEMDGSATSVTIDPSSWSSAMRGKVIKMLKLGSVIGGYQSKAAVIVGAFASSYKLDLIISHSAEVVRRHNVPAKLHKDIADEITASATNQRLKNKGMTSQHIIAAAQEAIDNLYKRNYLSYTFDTASRAERVRGVLVRAIPDSQMQTIEKLCAAIKLGTSCTFTIRN